MLKSAEDVVRAFFRDLAVLSAFARCLDDDELTASGLVVFLTWFVWTSDIVRVAKELATSDSQEPKKTPAEIADNILKVIMQQCCFTFENTAGFFVPFRFRLPVPVGREGPQKHAYFRSVLKAYDEHRWLEDISALIASVTTARRRTAKSSKRN